MNDKELADAVVALGVGTKDGENQYGIPYDYSRLVPAKYFCDDWRVAGALMEKCRSLDYDHDLDDNDYTVSVWTSSSFTGPSATMGNESLPRAIIEACVEALT